MVILLDSKDIQDVQHELLYFEMMQNTENHTYIFLLIFIVENK